MKHSSLRSGREYAQKSGTNEMKAGTKVGVAMNGDALNRGRGRPRKTINLKDEAGHDTSSNTAATINHNVTKDDEVVIEEAIPSSSLASTPKRGRGRPRKSLNVQFVSSQEEGMIQTSQHSVTARVDEDLKDKEAERTIPPIAGSKRKRGRPKKIDNVNVDGTQSNGLSISNMVLDGEESGRNEMSPSNFTAINGVNQQFDVSAEVQEDEESDDFGNEADDQGESTHLIADTGYGRSAHETHGNSINKLASSPSLDPSFPTKRGRGRPPKKAKTSVDGAGSLSAVSSNGVKFLHQLTNSSDEDSNQQAYSMSHALKGGLTRALTKSPRKILQYRMSPTVGLVGRNGPDVSDEVQHTSPRERVKTVVDDLKTSDAGESPLDTTEDYLDRPNDASVIGQSYRIAPESQTSNASDWVYKAPTALMVPNELSNTSAPQLPHNFTVQNNHAPNKDSGHISDTVQSEPSILGQVYSPLHGEHTSSYLIAPANSFEEDHKVVLTALNYSMAPSELGASESSRVERASEDYTNEPVDAEIAERDAV